MSKTIEAGSTLLQQPRIEVVYLTYPPSTPEQETQWRRAFVATIPSPDAFPIIERRIMEHAVDALLQRRDFTTSEASRAAYESPDTNPQYVRNMKRALNTRLGVSSLSLTTIEPSNPKREATTRLTPTGYDPHTPFPDAIAKRIVQLATGEIVNTNRERKNKNRALQRVFSENPTSQELAYVAAFFTSHDRLKEVPEAYRPLLALTRDRFMAQRLFTTENAAEALLQDTTTSSIALTREARHVLNRFLKGYNLVISNTNHAPNPHSPHTYRLAIRDSDLINFSVATALKPLDSQPLSELEARALSLIQNSQSGKTSSTICVRLFGQNGIKKVGLVAETLLSLRIRGLIGVSQNEKHQNIYTSIPQGRVLQEGVDELLPASSASSTETAA
ncbi:MAG: hypothetical protein HYV40_00335 [Candidatus Levybacteria bacterium]|nr:hypothetical protein [Candidatus Levybacteria bacterium]